MVLKKKSIGFFGGTFNPIHLGHLIAAEYAKEFSSLDTVYFIPTGTPSHKEKVANISPMHRVQMVRLAIQTNPSFSLLLHDVQRDCPTFTIDTLVELSREFPREEYQYFFIVGSDAILTLPFWKSPQKILEYTEFLVGRRQADFLVEEFLTPVYRKIPEANKKIHFFPMPFIEISSTMIRERLSHKKSIQYLVPRTVESYIDTNNLYKEA